MLNLLREGFLIAYPRRLATCLSLKTSHKDLCLVFGVVLSGSAAPRRLNCLKMRAHPDRLFAFYRSQKTGKSFARGNAAKRYAAFIKLKRAKGVSVLYQLS